MNSVYFQTMGMAIIILLLVMFYSKIRIDNRETKIYSKQLIVTFFSLLFDISIILITYFCDIQDVYYILWILNKFYLSTLLLYSALFTEYIVHISKPNSKYDFFNSSLTSYKLFNMVCVFIIFVLPIEIYNTNGVMFSYGLSISFLIIVIVFYVLVMVFYTFKNFKHVVRKKYTPLFSLIPLFLLAILIRKVDPSVLITTAIASYVDLIMYFTIENPDVKMIAALNEAKLSAEKANRAKSDFLSSMSHEIRTPLNAIVGFSDCIIEDKTLEDAKSDAKDIKLASENLLEIVNGILDISKIEADKMEIVETEYNPVETFENVAKLVKPRIGEKPIDLVVKFGSDIPYMVYGDGGKVRQIITNILTNAVKYTEEGSITFFVNCLNEGEYTKFVISVEDTGRGIKPEQIDKLFTKFQRLDEDKNTTLEGTGLGLAITKRFVEMMGGKIVVQSKYGEGSKFTVYLSQKVIKMNKPEDVESQELVNTMQIKLFDFTESKVLVVDDNKVNIKVALKLLSNYGIEADFCESGFEAVEKVKMGNTYDLILLDVMMPRMSGVETLKLIRESVIYDMPVVALTANAISGMKEKYLAEGFDDYLAKPIEKSELYRVLLTFLNKKLKKKEEVKTNTVEIPIVKKSAEKKKVLIVDDNKINIKIAEKLLSHYDFLEIDSALSGKSAIEKVKTTNYDLIFMDIMMPEMDGVETLHHLKDMGFINPIVTLTADAVDGSRDKYLSEGFDEYVSKPVSMNDMDKIIDTFINKG